MQNPLTPVALFDTPTSVEDLQEWLMRLNGSERTLAMTAAAMSWNLAAHIVDQEIAKETA
jgi:hypothetical protein